MKRIKRRISLTFSQIRRSQTVTNDVPDTQKQPGESDVRWFSSTNPAMSTGLFVNGSANGAVPPGPTRLCNSQSVSGPSFETACSPNELNEASGLRDRERDGSGVNGNGGGSHTQQATGVTYYYTRIPRSSTIAVGSSSRSASFCDARLPLSVSGDFAPRCDTTRTPTMTPMSTQAQAAAGANSSQRLKDKEKRFALARFAAFLRRGVTERRPSTASPSKAMRARSASTSTSRSTSTAATSAVTSRIYVTITNNHNFETTETNSAGNAAGVPSRTPRNNKTDALETVVDADADPDAEVDSAKKHMSPSADRTDDQMQHSVASDASPKLHDVSPLQPNLLHVVAAQSEKENASRSRARGETTIGIGLSVSMHEQLLADRVWTDSQSSSQLRNAVLLRNTLTVGAYSNGGSRNAISNGSGDGSASADVTRKVSRRETRASMYEMGYGRIESYLKLERLGEGTYATVFKGKSLLTNALVALKEIRLEHDEGAPCTAIREVSLLRQLKHANIVTLHDIIHTENALTLVFEYVGKDLKQYMEERHNLLHTHNIKLFLFQLLRGLHFCHQRNILHRDLKPQNLLISPRGELKLADFGLARAKSIPIKTYSHEVVTLWYRPPDILLGSTDYSTPIDMWGVGCILFEMATGRPMFPGTTVPNQLNMIFRVLGTPTEVTWPGVEQNDEFLQLRCAAFAPENIQKLAPRLDTIAVDLLLAFLRYMPASRISADSAMRHRYFEQLGAAVLELHYTDSLMDVPAVALKRDPGAGPLRGTTHTSSMHPHVYQLPHSHSQFINAAAPGNTFVRPAVAPVADSASGTPSKFDTARRQSMLA